MRISADARIPSILQASDGFSDPVPGYLFNYRMAAGDLADGVNGPVNVNGIELPDEKSIRFNGVDQSLDKGADASKIVGTEGEFTIALWAAPSVGATAAQTRQIFAYGASGGGEDGFAVQINSGFKRMRFRSNGIGFNSAVDLTEAAWNHIIITYDGTTARMWVNNANEATNVQTVNTFSETAILNIGCNTSCTTNFWLGELDGIRYYPFEVSAAQRAALYGNT